MMLYLLMLVIGGGMLVVGAVGVIIASGLWIPILILFVVLSIVNVFDKPKTPPPSQSSYRFPRQRHWWDE